MKKYFSRIKINKYYLGLFVITFCIMCLGVYLNYKEDYVNITDFGLATFYNIQSTGFSIVFYLLALFVVPNIFSVQIVIEKQNTYSKFLKTRMGTANYHITNLVANSMLTFIFMMSLEILLLFYIHFFLFPLSFQYMGIESVTTGIIANPLINLIIYIPLSALGYTVFSNFILSLKGLINNPYIYRGTGIIIGIILSVLPVIIANVIYRTFEIKLFDIFSIIYLPTILLPGVEGFGAFTPYLSPLILYTLSVLLYSFMTYLFLKISNELEYKNEI